MPGALPTTTAREERKMENDAIHEDVSEIQEETQEQEPRSPRDAVIAGMKAKKDVAEEPVEEEVAEVEDPVEDPKEEELVPIKVDGKEQMVPKSKVFEMGVRTLQKETAADQRLAQVNAKMRELEDLKRRVQTETKNTSIPDLSDLKKKFSQALVEDEDQAAELFGKMAERQAKLEAQLERVSGSLEMNEIFLKKQAEAERRRRFNHFTSNYPDLAGEPVFTGWANEITKVLQNQHPEMDDIKIIDTAAQMVRERIMKTVGKPEQVPSNPKQTMPKPVKKASGKLPVKPEVKPKTKAEVIADLRRARGLPV